jgi:mannose-1-phosphate guanylyltransferase
MPIKGVIVAGGEGKRFRPLTYYIQKCMIPVGDAEKPILEYIVRLLHFHHVDHHVLLVGYKHKQIVNYFGDGKRFDVKMNYIMDPPDQKGSAAALLNAYKQGTIGLEDTLVIYYGDILSNIDLSEMLKQHQESNAEVTVALARRFNISVGVADVEEKRIKAFVEKPDLEKPVSIGILVFNGSVLEIMEKMQSKHGAKSYDIMGDVVSIMVQQGHNVGAYITDAEWMDIGSIERYEKLEGDTLSKMLGYLYK